MQLPSLSLAGGSQQMLDTFGGYDHNLRIREGTWYDEQNMMSEDYPVLATRRSRTRSAAPITAAGGMITKDALAYVSGSRIVYNGDAFNVGLSTAVSMCPKQLISMGVYLLIWPDKKWFNTADDTFGDMENSRAAASNAQITVTLCQQSGSSYGDTVTSDTEPGNKTAGTLWVDTSNPSVPVLKEWSADSGMWVTIPTTYVKISCAQIGLGFEQYDGVEISGLENDLAQFNGSHVIYAVDDGYIVVAGILTTNSNTQTGGLKVERKVPDMDYVTECDNRIWGCYYGLKDGKTVNEIYASKQGDFKNWSCFMGLATDSYAAGRGSDGVFTGAVTHQGHPLFFKEDVIEKVYPSSTGAHQIVTTEARGVQKGCWRSLQIVGETLYYKSRSDVCAYTGALPTGVSYALGDDTFDDARAGAVGDLYYISMHRTADDTWHMFVYDTARQIWHREDAVKALDFSTTDGVLQYIDEDTGYLMSCGGPDAGYDVSWYLESGVVGYDLAENEYVTRFVVRCDTDGDVQLQIAYDNSEWQDKGTVTMHGLGSFVLPVPPRRTDHLRLRFSGDRPIKIYSITKYVERGSDVMW